MKPLTPDDPDLMAYLRASSRRFENAVRRVAKKNPELGPTVYIVASDMVSGEDWAEAIRKNKVTAEQAVWRVGSFARLDWAIKHCSPQFVINNLPRLWVGSDPDDTKPAYLNLWRRAFKLNGNRIICDGPELPRGELFKLCRGQSEGAPRGISWSRSRKVARQFADGAGVRFKLTDGVVIEEIVHRSRILAYLTSRKEFECIVAPE